MSLITLIAFKFLSLLGPYALTVEEITPAMIQACRADENCMDLVDVNDGITVHNNCEGQL